LNIVWLRLLLQAVLIAPQPAWIVGDWAPRPSLCVSDEEIRFDTGGSYIHRDGEGIWILAGDQLTLSSTEGDDFGLSEVVQIRLGKPNTMELQWPDGTRNSYFRCH
jgi:hypothetical protein